MYMSRPVYIGKELLTNKQPRARPLGKLPVECGSTVVTDQCQQRFASRPKYIIAIRFSSLCLFSPADYVS